MHHHATARIARIARITPLLALAACDGTALEVPEPGVECEAVAITEADRNAPDQDRGQYTRVVEGPANSALVGQCPVEDQALLDGPDALFGFVAPIGGRYTFHKLGSAGMISLHASCDPLLEPLACGAQGEPMFGPLVVERTLRAGEGVLIQVDGYLVPRGRLGVEIIGPVGEGEVCAGRWHPAHGVPEAPRCADGLRCSPEGLCAVPPPDGRLTAACDPTFARCGDGLYCAEGACAVAPDPALRSGWARVREGRLYAEVVVDDPAGLIDGGALRVAGADGPAPAVARGGRYTLAMAVDAMPEALDLVDRAGVIWFSIPVLPQPAVDVGDPCAPGSERDRCVEGAVCVGPADDGRCVAVQVSAWRVPGGAGEVAIDIRGADLRGGPAVTAGAAVEPVAADADRWAGRTAAPVEGPVDVRYGGQRIARAVPVQAPPVAAEGDPCDPAGVVDRCDDPTFCARGVCAVDTPPVIDEAIVVDDGGEVALWVRGRDAEGNVSGFRFADREGRFTAPIDADVDPHDEAWAAAVEGDAFTAWVSLDTWFDVEAPLVAIDDRGFESAPFAAAPAPAPAFPPAGEGQPCDPRGLLWRCAEGLLCDQRDGGDPRPTCMALEPACPEGLGAPLPLDTPVTLAGPGAGRPTRVSCHEGGSGDPEHYLTFVAPADGVYEVVARGALPSGQLGLAVREGCVQRRTERYCGYPTRETVDGHAGYRYGAEARFEAREGEVLTVVVDAPAPPTVTARRLGGR